MDVYTARVMAALRFPFPQGRYSEDGDAVAFDELTRAAVDYQQEYVNELLHEHGQRAEGWEHQMNAVDFEDADQLPAYPDLLLDELDRISVRLRELEEYRDRLLIFARLFALEPQAARKLAERVGLSYSTILRNATDEDVSRVQAVAQHEAAALVHDKDAPRAEISSPHDLEVRQRLRVLAGPAPCGQAGR